MSKNGEIMLIADDGSEEAFFVVEKAEIAGREYLLVSNEPMEEENEEESEDDSDVEVEALILRVNAEEDGTVVYDVVEDEDELTILSKYFEELVEDIDVSM